MNSPIQLAQSILSLSDYDLTLSDLDSPVRSNRDLDPLKSINKIFKTRHCVNKYKSFLDHPILSIVSSKTRLEDFDFDSLVFEKGSEDVLKLIQCKICYHYKKSIKQCSGCEQVVCQTCHDKIEQKYKNYEGDENKVCPFCKTDDIINKWQITKTLSRFIEDIKVKCPFNCGDNFFHYNLIDEHIISCSSQLQECQSCKEIMSEDQFKTHCYTENDKDIVLVHSLDKACKNRKQCQLCFDFIKATEYDITLCPAMKKKITCPVCNNDSFSDGFTTIGEFISHIRKDLSSHIPFLLKDLNTIENSLKLGIFNTQQAFLTQTIKDLTTSNVFMAKQLAKHELSHTERENIELIDLVETLREQIKELKQPAQPKSNKRKYTRSFVSK